MIWRCQRAKEAADARFCLGQQMWILAVCLQKQSAIRVYFA
jgi:hypothetical protein